MRFAVISDLHVRIDGLLYGLDTQKRLDDVLSDIDREAPDLSGGYGGSCRLR